MAKCHPNDAIATPIPSISQIICFLQLLRFPHRSRSCIDNDMPIISNWLANVISSVGWVVIVGVAWTLSSRFTAIETNLTLLLTNHLPHIEQELRELRQEMLQRRNVAPTSVQVGGRYVE